MMSRKVAGWLAALTACVAAPAAEATEGAASYYFPGAFGSFLVAVPPEPGFSVASQTLIFGGNAQKSVLNGRQTFGINAFAVYEYLAGLYAFEQPILGGRLQVGVAAPVVGYATMTASLQTQRFGTFSGTASDTAFGDLMLTPFSLELELRRVQREDPADWSSRRPVTTTRTPSSMSAATTGPSTRRSASPGSTRRRGTELSVLPGLMINTMNPATDYRSGTEFHLDFMVNQFVADDIAVGIQGYWYKQIDGDSGAGATFGPFMGESFGMGPAVLWAPEQLKGRYAFIAEMACTTSPTPTA